MILSNLDELAKIVEKNRSGKTVVLATGTFDLFHYEHLKYLEGAKKQGEILVVAVKSNKCAALKSPDRPIITEHQRAAIVDAIRYVDYTVIVEYNPNIALEVKPENKQQEEWLLIFQDLFKILRPNVLYYENNPVLQSAREQIFEKFEIKGVMKERGKTASTTEIIKKMKN